MLTFFRFLSHVLSLRFFTLFFCCYAALDAAFSPYFSGFLLPQGMTYRVKLFLRQDTIERGLVPRATESSRRSQRDHLSNNFLISPTLRVILFESRYSRIGRAYFLVVPRISLNSATVISGFLLKKFLSAVIILL